MENPWRRYIGHEAKRTQVCLHQFCKHSYGPLRCSLTGKRRSRCASLTLQSELRNSPCCVPFLQFEKIYERSSSLCQFQGEACTRPSNPCCLQLQDENAAKLDRITTSRIGRTARREIKLPWFLFSKWREEIRRAAAMVRLRRSTASANAAAGHHSHTTQRVPATDGFSVCPSVLTLIQTT